MYGLWLRNLFHSINLNNEPPEQRREVLPENVLPACHIIHGRLNYLLHIRKTGAIAARCCDSCLPACDFVFQFEARNAPLESRYEGLHGCSQNYSFHRSESANKTLFLSFTWLFLSRLLFLCYFSGVSVYFDTWRDIYNPDPSLEKRWRRVVTLRAFFFQLWVSCGKYI